jgi:hypothetical protein
MATFDVTLETKLLFLAHMNSNKVYVSVKLTKP